MRVRRHDPCWYTTVGGGHNRFENTVLLVATVGIIQRQYLQAYVRRR
jgi:hypothetical protein